MAPQWLGELALDPAPPHHRMGTRATPEDQWLVGGDDVARQLTEKARLLGERPDEVFAVAGGRESPAAAELAAMVAGWLERHRPTADRHLDGSLHPLDAAGRLVPEDLCLLEQSSGWLLTAASLCFPSRWRLADKLGRPIGEIHGPVPHYRSELAGPVDRFLDRLPAGRIVWRRNWSLHADDTLFQPAPPPPGAPPADPASLVLRSERQALRRLPVTGAVAFTIRTQQVALAAVDAPEVRHGLAAALQSFSPELVGYKAGDFDPIAVARWLER